MTTARQSGGKGLRQFLDAEQQRDWLEGNTRLLDADERTESLEQHFKYVARFEKFLRRPQAEEVLGLLRIYAERCIPIPRQTERFYWSVSCLPSTSDKPLVRVNASWMELFTLYADGEDIRARFIVHLSDFTTDQSVSSESLDEELLERSVVEPNAMRKGQSPSKHPRILQIGNHGPAMIGEAAARIQSFRAGNIDMAEHPQIVTQCDIGEAFEQRPAASLGARRRHGPA